MQIIPHRKSIVVQVLPETQRTTSGLYLSDPSTEQSTRWAIVESIGSEVQLVQPGQEVLVNLLVARECGPSYVVPEYACLCTR